MKPLENKIMTKLIYSKIKKDKLLHVVKRVSDIKNEQDIRINLIDANNYIQCSLLKMSKGKTFRPHKHIWKNTAHIMTIAQESWVVIKGKVKCTFYDIDNSLLLNTILNPGDACFTLEGGHNYQSLQNDTIVYEYKTGPYEGQVNDKIFIDKIY